MPLRSKGPVNSGLGPTLTVFNRWGEQVYFEEDYGNTWSPDFDELAEATYYIILDFSNTTCHWRTSSTTG